jgi:hypothetical protein
MTICLRLHRVLQVNRPLGLFVWALFIITPLVIALTIHSQELDNDENNFPQA